MVYIIKEDNNFTLPKTDKKNKKKENTPRRIILFWDNDLQIKKNTSYITQKKTNQIIINMMQNGMEVLNAAAANAGKKKKI